MDDVERKRLIIDIYVKYNLTHTLVDDTRSLQKRTTDSRINVFFASTSRQRADLQAVYELFDQLVCSDGLRS